MYTLPGGISPMLPSESIEVVSEVYNPSGVLYKAYCEETRSKREDMPSRDRKSVV